MSGAEALPPVSKTAVGVAIVRADESRRPDKLFDDPYAQAFVDAAPGALNPLETVRDQKVVAKIAFHIAIRTKFFDDYFARAVADGCRQIVVVAAGLDTRAFRLQWPSDVTVFEVDLPAVFAFKEAVLERVGAVPACDRRVVAVDLRTGWLSRLRSAGHDPTAPTAWLAEGLLVYLSAAESEALLTAISSASAPGSRFAFESGFIEAVQADRAATAGSSFSAVTSLWAGGLDDNEGQWLSEHGWSTQFHQQSRLAADYGRPISRERPGGFTEATRD